jgi:hypothetical protein
MEDHRQYTHRVSQLASHYMHMLIVEKPTRLAQEIGLMLSHARAH